VITRTGNFRVVIAGGGVAALEAALALAELAPGRADVTLVAPNAEFVYRPMTVREPFSYGLARRYPLEPIARAAGARLLHGELARASDVMMEHPLALQLRNLQTLVEIAVDKNSTVVFPAPLIGTIQELGAFLQRETLAAGELPAPPELGPAASNGSPASK
jgi:NADPH-dependent 2,4-dienoyl-CoA reductase/sulfur reductase-like enzyme